MDQVIAIIEKPIAPTKASPGTAVELGPITRISPPRSIKPYRAPRAHTNHCRAIGGAFLAKVTKIELHPRFAKVESLLPLQQQNQQLFAVADFEISKIDVELGAGYGFTTGSDRFVLKAILGYAFAVASNSVGDAPSMPVKMGTPARSLQNAWVPGAAN